MRFGARVSIRTQLGCLLMLSGLIAIAVVSIACWITVHNFVLTLRGNRLTQVATLKASQLTLALQMMDGTVKALASRTWLRNSMLSRANGTATPQLWNTTTQNLQTAISGGQSEGLAIQAALFPVDPQPGEANRPIVNATDPDAQVPNDLLASTASNMIPESMGTPGQVPPTALYPNFTYTTGPGNLRTSSFNNRRLDISSVIFLGPLSLNESSVLFSITRPVTDQANSNILGWLTVVLDGRLILQVSHDSTALQSTGLNLIIGPQTGDNRFGNLSESKPLWDQASLVRNQPVHFVLPPSKGTARDWQRYRSDAKTDYRTPWMLSSYPAAELAFTTNQNSLRNGGFLLQNHNEYGGSVGVGFASPTSSLCDWVFMIEVSSKEVYQPIAQVRNVILICVFSTLAVLVCIMIPVTSVWAHPVRRLRAATAESIAVYSDSDSTAEKVNDFSTDQFTKSGRMGSSDTDQSRKDYLNSSSTNRRTTTRIPAEDRKDMHKLTGAKTQFRIPQRVKERKTFSFIHDELSDLTKVFNQMADELNLQYNRLEERVRERTAELEQSKKEAEAANESKSLFIANISHELKTPLNGILGMTAVCMKEEDPVRIKESLNIIYRSGDLLHNLLTDLLTFSKNQAGQALALDEKRFRLRDVASQVRAVFMNQALGNDVNLLISYEGPKVRAKPREEPVPIDGGDVIQNLLLLGDQNRILQVVINLVGNALKFTPKKGHVWMRMRQVHETSSSQPKSIESLTFAGGSDSYKDTASMSLPEKAPVVEISEDRIPPKEDNPTKGKVDTLSDRPPNDVNNSFPQCWFEFEVEDTGPGIDQEFQDKIFEPFVQGDVGLARKHGGTGLGLSICSQLAKLMSGTMKIKSEVGRGSTFCLRIPLKIMGYMDDTPRSSRTSSTVSIQRKHVEPAKPTEAEEKTRTSRLEPTQRSASIVSQLSKPRLLGLSQPFFSSGTPPMASPASETPPGTPKSRHSLRVLVAEDNDTNRKVVVRLLELEDVGNVVVAHDGEEALDKVRESMDSRIPFDLILMDIQMPRMDGRQSTRLIRQAGFTAPIVALTAFTDEMNEKECMDSGMDQFLGKPIKKQELKKVLRRFNAEKERKASFSESRSSVSPSTISPRKFSAIEGELAKNVPTS